VMKVPITIIHPVLLILCAVPFRNSLVREPGTNSCSYESKDADNDTDDASRVKAIVVAIVVTCAAVGRTTGSGRRQARAVCGLKTRRLDG
jgi:hypothetical protein